VLTEILLICRQLTKSQHLVGAWLPLRARAYFVTNTSISSISVISLMMLRMN